MKYKICQRGFEAVAYVSNIKYAKQIVLAVKYKKKLNLKKQKQRRTLEIWKCINT